MIKTTATLDFVAAGKVAAKIPGCSRVIPTSYGVYVEGADAWVCVACLAASAAERPREPLNCSNCGRMLRP